MNKNWLGIYKVPLFLSLTVAIALIAVQVLRSPFTIGFVFVGSLLGTFILDLDYFIYAYVIEPQAEFSKTITAYIKHRDFSNALQYIQYHKNDMGERTLHSVVFQLAMVGITLFGVSVAPNYFVKALILSTFANSIYRLTELYFAGDYDSWFWALKNKPARNHVMIYILFYSFTLA